MQCTLAFTSAPAELWQTYPNVLLASPSTLQTALFLAILCEAGVLSWPYSIVLCSEIMLPEFPVLWPPRIHTIRLLQDHRRTSAFPLLWWPLRAQPPVTVKADKPWTHWLLARAGNKSFWKVTQRMSVPWNRSPDYGVLSGMHAAEPVFGSLR